MQMLVNRSRLKVLLTALVAVFAISAVAAASASAAEEWRMNEIGFSGTAELATSLHINSNPILKVAATKTTLECTGIVVTKGEIIGGSNKGIVKSLEFTGCAAISPSGCKLASSTIKTNEIEATATDETSPKVALNFVPGSTAGGVFAKPNFGTGCPYTGPEPVKGSCKTESSNGQTNEKNHTLIATAAVCNKLELAGSPATFEGSASELHLTTNELWSFR